MKISTNRKKFIVCPEYTGSAVCVDVTPTKRYETAFGPKDKFKVVYEVDLLREDGSRFAVWSRPFTPSSNERSAFAPFIKDWFGKMPTKEEWEKFDTEELIGRSAEIVVVNEHGKGETYSNIKLIKPDKSANPLKPSGKFVRVKDRPPKENGGGYRRAEQPAADDGDLGATKIHVGRCKGLELRDLAPEQANALIEHWLPTAKVNPKPLADDKRLVAALEWWAANKAVTATGEDDDCPF